MRGIRYLCGAVLIICALVINCDLFQLYLYDFEDFCKTSFYVQDNIDTEIMKEEIWSLAEEYGVKVGFIDKNYEGDYATDIDIYCDEETEAYFNRNYYLRTGVYESLFSGEAVIDFHPFRELDASRMERELGGYFVLGSAGDAKAYKASLVDTYGGSIPRSSKTNSRLEAAEGLLLIWTVVIMLILLLTYYQTVRLRKEIVVRLTLGESAAGIIWKNIAADTLWYGGVFSCAACVIHRESGCFFFMWPCSIGAVAALLLFDSLVFLHLLHYDLKLSFSGVRLSEKLLPAGYAVKGILTFALAASIASGVAFVSQYKDLDRQREFYESRQEYSYITLTGENYAEINELKPYFYRKYFEEFDIQFSCGNVMYDEENPLHNAICINANSAGLPV